MPRLPAYPAPHLRQPGRGRVSGDRRGEDTGASRAMICPDAKLSSAFSKIAGVLHFVEDHENPWAIVNCYKDLMPPGSYLVISHVTADHLSVQAAREAQAAYVGASAPGVARSREQISRFFAGLDMVSPGLVNVSGWRPDHIGPPPGPEVFYAGIGRKSVPGRPR
jgi:S-adenosyl methyltransferase